MNSYQFLVIMVSINDILGSINHECETDEVAHEHLHNDPKVAEHQKKNDEHWQKIKDITGGHTQQWNKKHGTGNERRRLQGFDDHIDIPINFHILYNANSNPQDRIDYSVFIDRLQNINLNFNELNPDTSSNAPWNARTGNMDMSFYINKIIYKNVGNNSPYTWKSDNIMSSGAGGNDPIDVAHHLDIYLVRPRSPNEYRSAYASFPWDDDEEGIVFNMGLVNGVWAEFDWGQYHTIWTHEIGHWVGLYHIWGCCNAAPNCVDDDGVVDTANMGSKWDNQCPAAGVNSCAGGDGDNYENFMSYASCINMFTDGQAARARANFVADGDREGFIDYQINPTASQFVNMIYFVGINENCMPGSEDTKKNIYSANNGGQYALCVSYSNNPHIDVYTDITIIQGLNTACPNDYFKIDNNLQNGGVEYFVCYKKESQQNPLSANTIEDISIIDTDVDLNGASTENNEVVIYDWPSCDNWCLTDYGGCYAAAGKNCHQIINAIYRVNGMCYKALTNCWGCLPSPNSYPQALQPVTCPGSTTNSLCDGHCGLSPPNSGCWCDSSCASYGDCCPGREEVCGASINNFFTPRQRPKQEPYSNIGIQYIEWALIVLLICLSIYGCLKGKNKGIKKLQHDIIQQNDSESDVTDAEMPLNE